MNYLHYCSVFNPTLPGVTQKKLYWGRLYGNSKGLLLASAAREHDGLLLVVVPDNPQATHLENELRFYTANSDIEILPFPDWETLPYDLFSPHQDIVSQRLETLYRLPGLKKGILIVPVTTLMQRLIPSDYLQAHSLVLKTGERLDPDQMRLQLEQAGYRYVSQVFEHGEFTIRGSLLDMFPSGSAFPYRIDLFDDEIESIRIFDPETQRTLQNVDSIRMLPAAEYPRTDEAISRFRQSYRKRFEGNPQNSIIYRETSQGVSPSGIEYYLPLFYEKTNCLMEYLPASTLMVRLEGTDAAEEKFWLQLEERYEQRRHDIERPILAPAEIYLDKQETDELLSRLPTIEMQVFEHQTQFPSDRVNFATAAPPLLIIQSQSKEPYAALHTFLDEFQGRILIAAESTGRRESILEILRKTSVHPKLVENWNDFLNSDHALAITVAPLSDGLVLLEPSIAIIAESQLFGTRAIQQRRRKRSTAESENIVRNLTDLTIGAPVVHEEHGVGRYLGLQKLNIGKVDAEYLTLEYAGGDKLYVPVASLHLISRYSGASPENAPLHKLGSDHWQKARRKAAERAHDVAAELLDIYARRAARKGFAYPSHEEEYLRFVSSFPFEETPDQEGAIEAVRKDMETEQPMDRLVCGDVGFGKTEVAMRAAFIAVQGGKQVAVLVPTTLLAQQHYQNFQDRFSDWPFRIGSLSRFQNKKETDQTLKELREGKIDIVIGTHKLLQKDIEYRNLGLVIIDEEHRFGVRQKEMLKRLRTEVDVLTLTATPIPRTLNMSLSGLRDLSIIATPPMERVAIKTFVSEWDKNLLMEAFLREIKRGGQVYFLHNEVSSIEKMANEIRALIPEASVEVAHGQMREKELEQVMLDFYHQRFNVLVCTTIIESGIDVPTANTIIINRADKLGLAQLHQIRGRVGRSHHRAYAYMIIPDKKSITDDARKRLEAIESLEDLGAGFMLATHDLEIRGAGELLGEDQSGQIQEIGFTLYMELLDRAVKALKAGKMPELDKPLDHGPEVDLHVPALLPDDYLPDIHTRLIFYKRIASAENDEQLRELQVEMIDRFGLLPQSSKNLIRITELKLKAMPMGIRKIDASENGGRIIFGPEPKIDTVQLIQLIQKQPTHYRLDGQDKLRFIEPMEDRELRFNRVESLLETLSPKVE